MDVVITKIPWLLTILGVVVYLLGAFLSWYGFYTLQYALDASEKGTVVSNIHTAVFSLFWEQLLWSIPGGRRRRAEYVKKMADKQIADKEIIDEQMTGNKITSDKSLAVLCGREHVWRFQKVIVYDLDDYAECADDVLPPRWHFWLYMVLAPLVWPMTLPLVIIVMIMQLLIAHWRIFSLTKLRR